MKVLHLNTFDNIGGAARAAYRLHKQLVAMSIDSVMYVQKKTTDDSKVLDSSFKSTRSFNKIMPLLDSLPLTFYNKDKKSFWSLNWFPRNLVVKDIKRINPDIIHVHWIGAGFISLKMLGRFKKPIVWTMHDSWAFTGGCHLPYDCKRYMEQCGHCPQLRSKRENDLSRINFKSKYKRVNNAEIRIVTPSHWMAKNVSGSKMLGENPLNIIRNGIDLNLFKPLDKTQCRVALNLNQGKTYILFCSGNFSDENKGFNFFLEAMNILGRTCNNIVALLVGSNNPPIRTDISLEYEILGTMSDDYSLAMAYSAADITCVPSLFDNQPQTGTESLACGTPVAAFNSSGLPDVVDHRVNGFLAKLNDAHDLASGMSWMLDNLQMLSINARKKAEQDFDIASQAKEYSMLYKSLVS